MAARTCTAPTSAGRPCRANAQADRACCFIHDPAREAERAEARRRGGEAKATATRVTKYWLAVGSAIQPGDLPALLRGAALAVASGKLEPGRAVALATVARASIAIREAIEIEARLAKLEAANDEGRTS
jgi:hypothetical protein